MGRTAWDSRSTAVPEQDNCVAETEGVGLGTGVDVWGVAWKGRGGEDTCLSACWWPWAIGGASGWTTSPPRARG